MGPQLEATGCDRTKIMSGSISGVRTVCLSKHITWDEPKSRGHEAGFRQQVMAPLAQLSILGVTARAKAYMVDGWPCAGLLQKSCSWLSLGAHLLTRMILQGVRPLTTQKYFNRFQRLCGSPDTFLLRLSYQATSGTKSGRPRPFLSGLPVSVMLCCAAASCRGLNARNNLEC